MVSQKIQFLGLAILLIATSGCSMLPSSQTSKGYKDDLAKMDNEILMQQGYMNEYGVSSDEIPFAHKPLNYPLSTYHIDFPSESSKSGKVVDKSDTWLKRNLW